MLVRLFAGLALIPLLIFLVVGGVPLYLLEALMLSIAINEFYKAFNNKEIKPIVGVAYFFIFYLFLKNTFNLNPIYTEAVIFSLFVFSITYLLRVKNNIIDIAITFFGIFYVLVSMDFIILTRDSFELGHTYVYTIFLISFATDTFAYFSGYLFGKHKLIPKVSPKKTIEGSIGGILGSTICCSLFGYIFNLNVIHLAFVGFIGSIVAQFGDLFASSIKRFVGIKDYGKLIPGHGGILDRFDSVILVAPFVYYSILLFNF